METTEDWPYSRKFYFLRLLSNAVVFLSAWLQQLWASPTQNFIMKKAIRCKTAPLSCLAAALVTGLHISAPSNRLLSSKADADFAHRSRMARSPARRCLSFYDLQMVARSLQRYKDGCNPRQTSMAGRKHIAAAGQRKPLCLRRQSKMVTLKR